MTGDVTTLGFVRDESPGRNATPKPLGVTSGAGHDDRIDEEAPVLSEVSGTDDPRPDRRRELEVSGVWARRTRPGGRRVTRTNAPCIDVWLPGLEATAKVQLMERDSDLDPYLNGDGTMTVDDHFDVILDHVVEPKLERDHLDQMAMKDVAALFEHIVQDATGKAAVPGDGQTGGWDA